MKERFIKLFSGFLSGTILLESCTNGYYMDFPADEINRQIAGKIDSNNSIAIPVQIKISENDTEYIFFLQRLATDIVNHPEIAEEFINNPNQYIEEKGFNSKHIVVDSKLTKIILALADKNICSAIEQGNIGEYLSLLKERGLMEKISINDIDSISKSQIEIQKILTRNSAITNLETQASAVAFAVAVIVGAVAVVWAVVVEHFGVANAVGAVTALAWKVAATTSGNKRRKNGALVENLMTFNTIEVWNIKSQNKEMAYIVADEFTNETVNSLMQYIKKNFPEEYSKYNEDILRNAILINLQNANFEE